MTRSSKLNTLRDDIMRMGAAVGAESTDFPAFGKHSVEGGQVSVLGGVYRYRYQERGATIAEFNTANADELAYHVMEAITFSVASRYEVRHRRNDEDSRRQLFQKQEELLGRINAHWENKKKLEHEAVLSQYPFHDSPGR